MSSQKRRMELSEERRDKIGGFRDLLAQQGILKELRPQKPASMDDEDWEELQQRAAGNREVWKKLEIQFMSKSITNKLYMKQRLYGLKMQEGSNLAQHVNVFNQIRGTDRNRDKE
ncbi:UNVERIFIED_CONTAM: Retrovirus-related Pol polyprotein from transposon TNT 1-94 [Sesamum latifolium]|uniref:Retrovirus-related Pol polyprotein from transposon TNT 1-94 n=1 Tax=Sesamum latifolium TaxID=2727402 RepID=A0AAW2X2W3_9LAMI